MAIQVKDFISITGWPKYEGEVGEVVRIGTRDDQPYYGLEMGVGHIVWVSPANVGEHILAS